MYLNKKFQDCATSGSLNKTKEISIIKELPDIVNTSSVDTRSIKPTKCLRPAGHRNDSEVRQLASEMISPLISMDELKTKPKIKSDTETCSTNKTFDNSMKTNGDLKGLNKKWSEILPEDSISVQINVVMGLMGDTFYDIDYFDMDYINDKEDFLLSEPESPDLGDFDELQGKVEFNEFGSNFKSEINNDKEDFDYYKYFGKTCKNA